jgi:hypothetical protein
MAPEPLTAARPRSADDDVTASSAPALPQNGLAVMVACILALMVF